MTIYDLAKKAGVSTATVSRALNNRSGIKPQTKARILELLEQANYSPNEIARSLAIRSTNSVAMLATDIRDRSYVQIAYAIERGLAPKGIYSFFCSMGRESGRQVEYIRSMVARRVQAIVYIGTPARDTRVISTLLEVSKEIPTLITNSNLPGDNVYCIQRDDAAGVRISMDHLIAQGCRRLALVSDFCYASDQIKQSAFTDYLGHLTAGGLTGRVIACEEGLEGSLALATQLCRDSDACDGFICAHDVIAAGIVKGFTNQGLRVPFERKVTGCENTFIAELTTPSLTSVDYQLERQGEIAVDILAHLCANRQPAQHYHLIMPALVVRESSQSSPPRASE